MPDSLTQPDTHQAALEALDEAGAHFVLCLGEEEAALIPDGKPKKAMEIGWNKNPAAMAKVLARSRKGLPSGVLPASLGCVVIDVDFGGDKTRDEVIARLGQPMAIVRTPRTDAKGYHLWYRCREADGIGNSDWRDGQIRGGKGYAILWHPEIVADALGDNSRPVADLMATDLARLPPAEPKGGEPGNRNNTLNKSVFLATINGEPIEPHVDTARQAGLPEREITATVESAVAGAVRKGVRTLVANARTPAALAFCLASLGVELQLNTRAKRYEYCLGGKWEVADDERDAWLRHEIAEKFQTKGGANAAMPLKYSADVFLDLRRALGNDLRRDPFRDWLETLPPWDGVQRIDGLLTKLFGAEDDPLTHWASRYIGIGAIQRTFEPGCKLDEVPVLLGEQGVGKSAFPRNWFSEAQHEWHGDAVDLGARPKEQAEQLAGKVVVELSEMTGIRKAELERLKSFLSRQDDGQFRWAYARAAVPSPRVCIFIGTTNEAECLPNDPSGNRRFVVVALERGCDVEAESVDRNQWWSEALSRYRDGERANLPRDLHTLAAERAEDHRDRDAGEDDVRAAATMCLVSNPDGFSLEDLRNELRMGDPEWDLRIDKKLQMRLATALKNQGFRKSRKLLQGTRQMLWSRA